MFKWKKTTTKKQSEYKNRTLINLREKKNKKISLVNLLMTF